MTTCAKLLPRVGNSPVTISYSMSPRDHTSVRASTGRSASACSGDMYIGVPISEPAAVSVDWFGSPLPTCFTMPKSSNFTSPSFVTKAFAGLRSR